MRSLDDFRGRWAIDRSIRDLHGGPDAVFTGVAEFTAHDDGLLMHESGHLVLGGSAPMIAERRYLWQRDGARIAVFFDDGRPFHSFDPAGESPQAHHDCAPDVYDVAYDFSNWPEWQATWHVSGPRKKYESRSRFFRA